MGSHYIGPINVASLGVEIRSAASKYYLICINGRKGLYTKVVVRQNISGDQIGTFLGREDLNTILASTQREAFGRGSRASNLCRMFNRAIRGQLWLPKYLSSDNDPLYRFHQWQANLQILEVTEI